MLFHSEQQRKPLGRHSRGFLFLILVWKGLNPQASYRLCFCFLQIKLLRTNRKTMKGNTNKFMKIHEITPKDYTDLHRLYCQLEDDWTSDIQDMIRVLEEVKDDPHYHLVGIFDDADKLVGTITLSKCLDLTAKARFYYSLENLVIDENYRQQGYGQALMQYVRLCAPTQRTLSI